MKKIGIMFGEKDSFPTALHDNINDRGAPGVKAEYVTIGAMKIDDLIGYNVIFDRVSHEVPYYNSVLKLAVLEGVKVINNPFWNCADDNFFHNLISHRMKMNVPKTVILPTKEHPAGTTSNTFRNMEFPINWDTLFDYVGFPAYLKPNIENNSHIFLKVYNKSEFFTAYDMTGSAVMLLQEAIDYTDFYRCYVVGKKNIKIINYDPSKPKQFRFTGSPKSIPEDLWNEMEMMSMKICSALGYDFNVVEFAVKDGIPYVVEFINKSPVVDEMQLHHEHFKWLVNTTAEFLIENARSRKVKAGMFDWVNFLGVERPINRRRK